MILNQALNVGAIMGPKSGGLTDVDLDCKEAVALAPYFLPATGAVYGRPGKRRSHWLYTCGDPEPKASTKLTDENKAVIVELRMGGGGKGSQSIMPGSTHPSGEVYAWDQDGEKASATCADLKVAISKIAAATIFVRHWPERNRHDAAMCVGGFLARTGWSAEDIGHFIVAVQEVAGVEDNAHVENGKAAAIDAAERHADGGQVYGLPTLIEFFGEAPAKQIAKLIGFRKEAAEPTNDAGLPVVKITGGTLSKSADEAETILIDAGIPFYERSDELMRPIVKTVDGFHGHKTKVAHLTKVEQIYMRDVLGRVAGWYKFDARSNRWVPIDPPHDVASTVLARAGEWAFPSIAGIIGTQTLRPDGTVLDQEGYDPATRLLLVDPPAMTPIPDNPTRDEPLAALLYSEDLLVEFPLLDDVDHSVALSMMHHAGRARCLPGGADAHRRRPRSGNRQELSLRHRVHDRHRPARCP